MRIDIWTDIICPFCFLGVRHLELALDGFEHRDEVELVWHSFELDPDAPADQGTVVDFMVNRHGLSRAQAEQAQRQVAAQAEAVGLDFEWQVARPGNTMDAHRLVHLAARHGLATEMHAALRTAYFTDGVAIGQRDQLLPVAEAVGLDGDEVRALWADDEFVDAVRADERMAHELGIAGVPYMVFADAWSVSGAQPVELFRQALEQAWTDSRELPPAGG